MLWHLNSLQPNGMDVEGDVGEPPHPMTPLHSPCMHLCTQGSVAEKWLYATYGNHPHKEDLPVLLNWIIFQMFTEGKHYW